MREAGSSTPATLEESVRRFVAAFPWIRVRWRVRLLGPFSVEQYAGGMVRGALGWEIQELLCARPRGRLCGAEQCGAPERCGFGELFSPVSRPDLRYPPIAPLIVEAPPMGALAVPSGGAFEISVVLVGRARRHLTTLAQAMRRAGERGLGSRSVKFRVEEVALVDAGGAHELSLDSAGELRVPERPGALPQPSMSGARLAFETLLSLKTRGRTIDRGPIPASAIVRSLCRRAGVLADYHAPDMAQPDWRAVAQLADSLATIPGEFRHFAWRRRSQRQGRSMTLTGVVGHLDWRDIPPALAPLVSLGSVLHLGKKASLGLGRYRLEPLPLA